MKIRGIQITAGDIFTMQNNAKNRVCYIFQFKEMTIDMDTENIVITKKDLEELITQMREKEGKK